MSYWCHIGANYMEEERTQFTLRINTKIWEKLKKIAAANRRSAAKEVEYIIEQYIKSIEK